MNLPSCTLVTACFDMRKYHPRGRTVDETLAGLEVLLQIPVYLIIHTDPFYAPLIQEKRASYGYGGLTHYVVEEFEHLWAAQYLATVQHNRNVYWPTRDLRTCAHSHLLCCNKFDFVLQAIQSNPFGTERFGWIDANLATHNGDPAQCQIKIAEQYDTHLVPRVLHEITDDRFHIQVLNVNDKRFLDPAHKREFYQQYRWVVCGSFFVCGPTTGTTVLTRAKEVMVASTLAGYGHAEEMFFLELLEEFTGHDGDPDLDPDQPLIVKSYGDYGQILNNIVRPLRNHGYILEHIVKGYFHRQYYRECLACCRALLDTYELAYVPMNRDLYMRFYKYYYVSVVALALVEEEKEMEAKLAALFAQDTAMQVAWERALADS